MESAVLSVQLNARIHAFLAFARAKRDKLNATAVERASETSRGRYGAW